MKKSLIALAVLGAFSGAASAQANVTLYGIIDIGIQYNSQFSPTYGTHIDRGQVKAGSQQSTWGVESGYDLGSRFGLRGSEALGGGLSAIFQLEAGFDASTGASAQGGLLFGRQAYAGLSSDKWGAVVLGRIATFSSGTGAFDMFSQIDPFQAGFGVNGIGSTFISANALRVDNAVAYVSPVWAGLKLGLAYSFNIAGSETAPQNQNSSAFASGLSYTWGPLYAALTYDILSPPNTCKPSCTTNKPLAGNPDQKNLQLGATWDFNVVKVSAAWANQSNISVINIIPQQDIAIPGGLGYYDNNAYMLGASVPLFGGSLLGSYQWSDGKNIQRLVGNAVVSFEPDYNVWGIGYAYSFSPRTTGYIGYGQRSAKGTLSSEVIDRDQFALGMIHKF
jgi:predicted porin